MAEPNVWTKNSTESDDGELLPWRGDPAELNSMGTPTRPTGHYCFGFGDDVPDRQSKASTRRRGRDSVGQLPGPDGIRNSLSPGDARGDRMSFLGHLECRERCIPLRGEHSALRRI